MPSGEKNRTSVSTVQHIIRKKYLYTVAANEFLQSEMVQQEGGQTSAHALEDMTEKEAYNASTIQGHHFNFFSAYRHYFRDGQPEVTTFHDQVCTTVDYMFVSSRTAAALPQVS
ncbi:Protein angel 2 [Desmophyllum pertusum]|uniref:Protein angel 2 n=1 Tax=Desmophyllum pertusum TaxID=174260 RepID=A0A9X0A5E8_9CNID|nr:Protein angel 2 [Desmophyllum pertusum]